MKLVDNLSSLPILLIADRAAISPTVKIIATGYFF
jgi:hypothetical protein